MTALNNIQHLSNALGDEVKKVAVPRRSNVSDEYIHFQIIRNIGEGSFFFSSMLVYLVMALEDIQNTLNSNGKVQRTHALLMKEQALDKALKWEKLDNEIESLRSFLLSESERIAQENGRLILFLGQHKSYLHD